MFNELDELLRSLEIKADSIENLKDEFSDWLKHPVTVAMMADLKCGYIKSMDDESAKQKREVVEEILNKWGSMPDED